MFGLDMFLIFFFLIYYINHLSGLGSLTFLNLHSLTEIRSMCCSNTCSVSLFSHLGCEFVLGFKVVLMSVSV